MKKKSLKRVQKEDAKVHKKKHRLFEAEEKLSKKEERLHKKAEKLEHKKKKKDPKPSKGKAKIEKVMKEGMAGKLHSGSKHGPIVKNKKQMVAIALSEARKAGARIPKKKSKK